MTDAQGKESPRLSLEELNAIQTRAFEYDSKLTELDPTYNFSLDDDLFEAVTSWMGSEDETQSSRHLHEQIGKLVIEASDLENQVAALLMVSSDVPSDPMAYASEFLGLSAYERSDRLRKAIKQIRSPHFKTFVDAIQGVAVFRNDLAHGGIRTFEIANEVFRTGWFLRNRKQRKNGKWYLRVKELTPGDFEQYSNRIHLLTIVLMSIRHHLFVTKEITGQPLLILDLREALSMFPASFITPDLARLRDEMFPPYR